MTTTKAEAIARFVRVYKGVEDFYFLNRSGQLGYISSTSLRLVKETFQVLHDDEFLMRYPEAVEEARRFEKALARLGDVLPPAPEMELGYVLPSDDMRPWKSATLVLHETVAEIIEETVRQQMRDGGMDLTQGARRIKRTVRERGLHHGLDDLFEHTGSFGNHPYFPVLYHRSKDEMPGEEQEAPLRVVNLKWVESLAADDGEPITFECVFSHLHAKLGSRGALNRARRLENRLRLVVANS